MGHLRDGLLVQPAVKRHAALAREERRVSVEAEAAATNLD